MSSLILLHQHTVALPLPVQLQGKQSSTRQSGESLDGLLSGEEGEIQNVESNCLLSLRKACK